jgi:nicotinate phosphoribosyltransferase
MGILASILDTDLYKLTMGQAVHEAAPESVARYVFINRDPARRFDAAFGERLRAEVDAMAALRLGDDEAAFLARACPFLTRSYLEWLRGFRFRPGPVRIAVADGRLDVSIEGPWRETIYWEVPLLALVSELRLAAEAPAPDLAGVAAKARAKAVRLHDAGCRFADFGTRRRLSRAVQSAVVSGLREVGSFVGTSNVRLAFEHGVKPIGTMAHEWIMAHSALMGIRHANRFALEAWQAVYRGSLGIALTDTFGTAAFFRDFDATLARLFDGVRQDSGDPEAFAQRTVQAYRALGIDPRGKTIVFSDSLDVDKAIRLQGACDRLGIRCSFGIGTHFTNDVEGVRPLNIVIKMAAIDGVPVVKLSDDAGKALGDPEALQVVKWIFRGDLGAS